MSRSANPQPPRQSSCGTCPTPSSPATAATTPSTTATAPSTTRSTWPACRGPRLGRRTARHQLGPAGHLHRRHRDGGPHHDVQPADRDPPRLLAARALRLRRGHPRPALRRPGPRQHRVRAGQPAPRTATSRATRRSATRAPRSSCGWSGGCGPRRTSPSRASTSPSRSRPCAPRPVVRGDRIHPRLYFGGASEAAEQVSATEADVQLFWGEPLDGVAERIDRLKALEREAGARPAAAGVRAADHHARPRHHRGGLARRRGEGRQDGARAADAPARTRRASRPSASSGCSTSPSAATCSTTCLYTAPGKYGGGGAGTTWLVGSAEDVADALRKYQELGITHFVLSDTPYKTEIAPGRRSCCRCCARRRWSPRPPSAWELSPVASSKITGSGPATKSDQLVGGPPPAVGYHPACRRPSPGTMRPARSTRIRKAGVLEAGRPTSAIPD